jgi:hypothetical protein
VTFLPVPWSRGARGYRKPGCWRYGASLELGDRSPLATKAEFNAAGAKAERAKRHEARVPVSVKADQFECEHN